MKASTSTRFNYALRPAKNIERKMLCEVFSRLSRIAPLATYRYVGFGAVGFYDFCLFHQRLGIEDMLSIEGDVTIQERVLHNKPYACIKMEWGLSHEVLPRLPWERRTILWLDYERPLCGDQLEDIILAAGQLVSGSALVITVPADSGELESGLNVDEKRLADLRSRVGKRWVPPDLVGKQLRKWGTAHAYQRIIVNVIEEALANRNAALESVDRVHFKQLFNFHYADGTKMLSTGGLLLNHDDDGKLGNGQFDDLSFCRQDDDAYLIESPILTLRETKILDERLPKPPTDSADPTWIPLQDREKYAKVYRYYPSFSEVEM